MEFDIAIAGEMPDCRVIEAAIGVVDPSVVVDIAPEGDRLRVSTIVGAAELLAVIRLAGYPVSSGQVKQIPSVCCGGCGG